MPNISGAVFALTILFSLGYWLRHVLPPVESKAVFASRRLPDRGLRQVPSQYRPNTEAAPKRSAFERAA